MLTAVAVDSQVVNCNRFGYQQVIHILRSLQAPKKVLDLDVGQKQRSVFIPNCLAKLSQVSTVCQDRYINESDQEKPVIPMSKAYWTRTVSRGQPSSTNEMDHSD